MSDIEKPRQELCDELSGLTSEQLMNIHPRKREFNQRRMAVIAFELTARLMEEQEFTA